MATPIRWPEIKVLKRAFLLFIPLLSGQPPLSSHYPFPQGWPFNFTWLCVRIMYMYSFLCVHQLVENTICSCAKSRICWHKTRVSKEGFQHFRIVFKTTGLKIYHGSCFHYLPYDWGENKLLLQTHLNTLRCFRSEFRIKIESIIRSTSSWLERRLQFLFK